MIIHFDCKNCDEPVQEHCADCYACFNGDAGHGLDCDGESISFFVYSLDGEDNKSSVKLLSTISASLKTYVL